MNHTQSQRMHLLLDAPIFTMLWTLGAPNVTAIVILTSVTYADAWFVGHLGTAQLASIAIAFPFQSLMMMMAGGAIGGGVTSAIARAFGSRDSAHAEAVLWHAMLIAVFMSALFVIILGILPRPVFTSIGAREAALDGAVRYATIAFGGATTTWLFYIFTAVMRGLGDIATPSRAIIVSSVAQIALSGILTLGWGPFEGIGVAGPAVAIVVCQGLASAYLAKRLIDGSAGIRLRPQRPTWRPFADIMKVGGIGLINSLTISVTVVVVTSLVAHYGTEALAGYGLGSRLELMLVPIVFGIGGVLTAVVGANIGAGQHARARRVALAGAAVAAVVTGTIGFAVTFFPGLWLDRFTTDPKAFVVGELYLGIAGPFFLLFGFGQTLYFASQGTGQMFWPVLVGVVRFAIVAAVGGSAVAWSLDLGVIFWGVSAGLTSIGIGLLFCLLGPAWRPPHG